METTRIIRIPLPLSALRSMDELISTGVGGFGTRAEFIREAIESQVLELKFQVAPEPGLNQATTVADTVNRLPHPVNHPPADIDFAATALAAPPAGIATRPRFKEARPGTLYGLHNRDYPSIWSARHLALAAHDGPVELKRFFADVTRAAWEFGELLLRLEAESRERLTPIFPTNRDKPQSAEEGFQAFAVGEISVADGMPSATGPLFVWGLATLSTTEGQLEIGATDLLEGFLSDLDGISAHLPHGEEHAEAFLRHLEAHAPGDFWGFVTVTRAAAESPSRDALIAAFAEGPYDWTAAQIETNAAGFVSRCREWGLVQQKQVHRRYRLTEFGEWLLRRWETK